jgi:hypothetical protein
LLWTKKSICELKLQLPQLVIKTHEMTLYSAHQNDEHSTKVKPTIGAEELSYLSSLLIHVNRTVSVFAVEKSSLPIVIKCMPKEKCVLHLCQGKSRSFSQQHWIHGST